MAESRLVPCNLMSWPEVRDLLPDQKLIVYHLWATSPSSAGCWLLDLAAAQAALSITRDALRDALREFERRGLLLLDESTGEIYVQKWFRWHVFDSAPRRRVLDGDLSRVESEKLLIKIKNDMKTMRCKPREVKGSKGTPIEVAAGVKRAGKAARELDAERQKLAGRAFSNAAGEVYKISACGVSFTIFDRDQRAVGRSGQITESFVEAVNSGRFSEIRF